MTYLELFQAAKRECRITGSAPASVAGNTEVLDRLANWVSAAYVDIQNRDDWRWLRHQFTLPLVASDGTYAYGDCTDSETSSAITRLSHWWLNDLENPPKCYLTATGVGGEYWLTFHAYEHFVTVYRRNLQPESNPSVCSVDYLDRIVIGPIPNDAYTMTGDYQLSAQTLALDADVPEMPAQFHMLIVYQAMQKYGYIEGSSEVLMRGQAEGNRMMRQLEINQKPRMRLGAPLA